MKYNIDKIKEILESGEPVFIIRGKDLLAKPLIMEYVNFAANSGCSQSFCLDIMNVAFDIEAWQYADENVDKCKYPD